MSQTKFPELGIYALPGHVAEPKQIFHEVEKADELGLGSVWIAERLNTKELGVLSGIAVARTNRMGIATGLMQNLPLRNPLVVAGFASTMMTVSDNRFALGIGRGTNTYADMSGTPRINMKLVEDYVDIMRRLWRGEQVSYEGPAGILRKASLGIKLDVLPPVIMGTLGPKTAYWAGKFCDGVVLNSLTTTEALKRFVKIIRQGAEDAGRDPASVKIWTILVTACEVPEEVMLQTVVRRMNTYMVVGKAFAPTLEANGWDEATCVEIRKKLAEIDGAPKAGSIGDEHTSRELSDLRKMKTFYPEEWIHDGCAVGTAAECAPLLLERFEAGADGVLLHGTSPDHLGPLLKEWEKIRPAGKFDNRSVNPGL